MMIAKPFMKIADLKKASATQIAVLNRKGHLVESNIDPKYPQADLTRDGFYFLVNRDDIVVARFYIGRQRSKCGFEAVVRHVREKRSKVCSKILDAFQTFDVYHVPTTQMKPLTTGVNKGKVGLLMTRQHNDRYQNIEEMNRMLNDHFKFLYQKY